MIGGVAILLALVCCGQIALAVRFADKADGLRKQLCAEKSRAEGLRKEAFYWLSQSDNYERRYKAARDGLKGVLRLKTNVMANVGCRMSRIAELALAKAETETFNK
jgi:hypothetical protein